MKKSIEISGLPVLNPDEEERLHLAFALLTDVICYEDEHRDRKCRRR